MLVWQVPRLIPYLSNGLFVLSERGVDQQLDANIENALVFVPANATRVRTQAPWLEVSVALSCLTPLACALCTSLLAFPPPKLRSFVLAAAVIIVGHASQLDSQFVSSYLGPENAARRKEIGSRAQALMKQRFRCSDTPGFQEGVSAVVYSCFPTWLLDSFFDPASSTLCTECPPS